MSSRPQHTTKKCYCCNNIRACCKTAKDCRKPTSPTYSSSTTIPTTVQSTPTKHKFIHINRNKNGRAGSATLVSNAAGLGHSHTLNQYDFSRRNSATTQASTTTTTTSCSNSSSKSERLGRRLQQHCRFNDKVEISNAHEPYSQLPPNLKYTERRKYYERSMQLLQQMGLTELQRTDISAIENLAKTSSLINAVDDAVDERFYALQQFRLANLDDCFTVYRQNDLKLQQQLPVKPTSLAQLPPTPQFHISLKPYKKKVEQKKNAVAIVNVAADNKQTKTLTPYAIRQRMLQLRLQAEATPATNAAAVKLQSNRSRNLYDCALDKSFALRFQETY